MVDNSVLNELKTMMKERDIDDTTALRLIITGQIRIIEKQDKIDERIDRIEVFVNRQKDLEKEVIEMKKMKDDVKENTKFRENWSKVFWVVAKILIAAATLVGLYGFVTNYLASQG